MHPQQQPEGSYEIGSVHPYFHRSVLPSLHEFSQNRLITFFRNSVKSPFIDVCDIVRFLKKNPDQVNMTKNGLKTGFLDFLRKSCH